MITKERLLELLEYKDGKLFWKVIPNRNGQICVGSRAGTEHGNGYWTISIDKKRYLEHRLVFLLFNGFMPVAIDHINGVKQDNRIENLRKCSISENGYNAGLSKRNKSGIKGVGFHKKSNKWRARILRNYKEVYLGLYETMEEAEESVKKAREFICGEFSRHA